MSGESAALRAIAITRIMLRLGLRDGTLPAYMAAEDVSPGDVEDVVVEILEYLEKTKEEEKPHG